MGQSPHQLNTATTALLVAIAYFVTGRLGLTLPAFGTTITLIWLPTGIAVAALFRFGFACWPGVTLGTLVTNFAVGTPIPVALGIAVGGTLGPVVSAWLLHRMNFHPTFARAKEILILGASALVGMLVTSTLGVICLRVGKVIEPDTTTQAWLTWLGGDTLGVILAAPMVLTFNAEEIRAIYRRNLEFLIWLVATTLATWAVFIANGGIPGEALALAFLPLPFVAWAALRFGTIGTSFALILISFGAAYGTAQQQGPFYKNDPVREVAVLWVYMSTGAALAWLISAIQTARLHATGIQQLFEQALADVSLGVLLAGLDRKITYANKGFERLTGYRESELLGKSCAMLQGASTSLETAKKLKAAVTNIDFFDDEILNYRKDGTPFWNALIVSPVKDETGTVTGFIGIQRDISQRKTTELSLLESENRFRRLVENAPEAITILDVDSGKLVQTNSAAERLFKLSAAELLRVGPLDMSPELQPNGEPSLKKIEEYIARTINGESPVFEWTHRDSEMRSIPCEVRLLQIEINGRPAVRGSITDITERKKAEFAIRESEERYRQLFDANPHPMWVYDRDTLSFLAVNTAAITHYGYTREEFLAMTIKDIRPPDEIPALLASVAASGNGIEKAGIWHHRLRNGTTIDVEISSHTLDFDGRRAKVVLANDVTERVRNEIRNSGERAVLEILSSDAPLSEVLERIAKSHEASFPGMLCSVLLMDPDGLHLRSGAAPSLPKVFTDAVEGLPIGPSVGSCGTAAFTRQTVIATDIATDPRWAQFKDFTIAQGLRACWSVPLISSQNKVLGTLALYYRTPATPKPEEFAAIERGAHFASLAIERHELRRSLHESQRRLETLVANLPGMAYRCVNDTNWTMTYVSDGCESVTGYKREDLENNTRIPYADLIHIDDREPLWAKCQKSLDARMPCMNEYRIVDAHGNERWVAERASGVYDPAGELLFIDGFIQDITSARHAKVEHELLDRKMQETQKLESLGVLAGGIAHDFNNLLTSILGNASLASMEIPLGSETSVCLEQIIEASMRAADLCKQMLAYSGRGRFIVQKLDLGELVEQTAQMLQISISKKCVLRFRLEKGIPPIEVDATQIRQVIMNLVINASEAIGDKSGVISLSTGVTWIDRNYFQGTLMDPDLPDGDYVFLEVSDSGCGMSPETKAKIFDPFFTTKFTGRGLGLAAVLGIVRGHKGALKVYTEPGRGTTFKLLFPATVGSTDTAVPGASPETAWHFAGTVLVVDDEETIRSTASRMMRMIGLNPIFACDGREAVELFRAEPERFDLVLLDLTMPHMDGAQAFTELRRIRPDVSVVLMSGFNAHEALIPFNGKGLAGFLQKPFTFSSLKTVLKSTLQSTAPEPSGHE